MSDKLMVSFAAVFRLVTQRSSPPTKGKEFGSKESSRLWGLERCVTSLERLRRALIG